MNDTTSKSSVEMTKVDVFEEENAVKKPAQAVGTVLLIHGQEVVLIPTPSPDPRDPLNLPKWRKWLVTITLGLFSITSVLITSGMGAILREVSASYNNDPRVNDLMTYPTLFMGIGNLIAMPLAMAVGRRPVILASSLILVIGSVWCAASGSLGSHIAGRDVLSLAAGQSEALCPLIIQEFFFLHERSTNLAVFSAIQSIGTAALTIATTYLVADLGFKWWYGIFGIVNGVILVMTYFFVPESKYDRPTDAFEGAVNIHQPGQDDRLERMTTQHGVVLDLVRYQPRTWAHDLKMFHGPAKWSAFFTCWKQMSQCVLFPNLLWIILMNSTVLGIYVIMSTEYAGVLLSPPYLMAPTSLGYLQVGQIIVSLIMVPIFGYGGDFLTRKLAQRKGGISESENRLIPIFIPIIVVIVSAIFFGKAAGDPMDWSLWTIIVTYTAEYFGFISIVLLGYTYSLDSYPERAAPILVLICAIRGLFSFGLSYGVTKFITVLGFKSAFNVCVIVFGVVSAFGIPVFIFGKKIRSYTARWAVDDKSLDLN